MAVIAVVKAVARGLLVDVSDCLVSNRGGASAGILGHTRVVLSRLRCLWADKPRLWI